MRIPTISEIFIALDSALDGRCAEFTIQIRNDRQTKLVIPKDLRKINYLWKESPMKRGKKRYVCN